MNENPPEDRHSVDSDGSAVVPRPDTKRRFNRTPPRDASETPVPAYEYSPVSVPNPGPEPAAAAPERKEPVAAPEEPEESSATTASAPLTERYVAVTLGYVPVSQREFAEPALRAAIGDEIEHRHDKLLGDEGTNRSDIEVEVLEDMGEPEQVAAAMTHRPKVLIGPRFYHDFKYILVWSLALVAIVAGALAMFSSSHEDADTWHMVAHVLGIALTAAVYAATWVTLGFAIAERVARHRAEVAAAEWTIDHLPDPTRSAISMSQTAVVVASSLAAAAAVIVQHVAPSVFTEQGDPVVFLNPDRWPWAWSALIALLAVNAQVAISRHVRGYWSLRAAIVNFVLLSATYGLLALMLADHSLLNDAFFEQVGWPTENLAPATIEDWALIAVGVLWIIGIGTGFLRAWRARVH